MSRQNFDIHLSNARGFYDDGNYEAARHAAEHAIDCAPESELPHAQVLLALSLRRLEFDDEAFKLLSELVEKNPVPEACAEYALMRSERGLCDEECKKYADMAIEEDPDLPAAYIALFGYYSAQDAYSEALGYLIRGIRRGADYPESRAFEILRSWCQQACDRGDFRQALELSAPVTDFFHSLDFLVLHARLAEFADEPRIAVSYYKEALIYLRPGTMRTDVLEAIARIAM